MDEQIEESPEQSDNKIDSIKINVEFELKTGIVRVSGHIDNTDLCMKVLVEAAHLILAKNSERDKARIQAQSAQLEAMASAVKRNGQNENTPPAAIN